MKFLVVVDMQNDFVTGKLGSPEAVAIVPMVVQKIKHTTCSVIFTQDVHAENEKSIESSMVPTHCIECTNGADIIKELKPFAIGAKIRKNTFGTNQLVKAIKDYADWYGGTIDSIELCGVCTDICVISNALMLRSAFPKVPILVDAKCCAGLTPEKHEAALNVMESCLIDVIKD